MTRRTPGRGATADAIGLPGGGRLGVAEYGRPDGRAVFYFHGAAGSRLEASLADRIANDLGVRIVSFDRPGMGLSTFRQGRSIPDIASDVERLADFLGIGTFSVLGVSGGAPYALASGIRLGARIARIGLVSPAGPFADRRYRPVLGTRLKIALYAAALAPSLCRSALRKASKAMRSDPERFLLGLATHAGSPDREVILAHSPFFTANLREAFREGDSGPICDAELLFRQWGFQASETARPVFLWHGGRDRILPQGIGIRLSEEIPHARSFYPPEEGHFSLPIGRMGEILSTLAKED